MQALRLSHTVKTRSAQILVAIPGVLCRTQTPSEPARSPRTYNSLPTVPLRKPLSSQLLHFYSILRATRTTSALEVRSNSTALNQTKSKQCGAVRKAAEGRLG